MIAYLSISGSGSTETLEQAALRAIEAGCPLISVAIVEDATFGDLDTTTMTMLLTELDFLLRAQVAVVGRHVGGDLETSVRVIRGTIGDVADTVKATAFLVGGPTVPGTDDVEQRIAMLRQQTGCPVELLS